MKTYTKQEALTEITELVNHFDKNIAGFKRRDFGEAQTENDLIRPLFGYLNWNVTNLGLEPEKQVFQLQVTGKTGTGDDLYKRPDYLVRIPDKENQTMKSAFFIEAKKPIYDLKTNEKYIRQVYQYAWSTLNSSDSPNNQVRLAILTDFEEFRLFDCQDPTPLMQNRAEAFNKHTIKDWTYKDYVTRFDELWDMFEYKNVVNGSLDKYHLTSKQISDKRITPDKQFLNDLKDWRLAIARSMYRNDKTLDDYRLTKATLLFINRIIFVKMLADRGIEPDYLTDILAQLSKTNKTDVKLFELCRDVFIRLDHVYNGSMFAYDSDADEIQIENSVLRNIFEELKPEKSIYTLAAMPVEIIGNVYELFIAEQIVKKGTGLAIVPKYDEKKAGGVYYTPRYIVEYIVDNTLGKKLEECKTPADVAKLKVLDPACGSGSFLIVAYQRLLEWHKKWYYEQIVKWGIGNEKTKKETSNTVRVIKESNTDIFSVHLSHKLKSDILVNNIFGVDIDPQAVLVTKFSLSIKALEDSTHDEVIEDNNMFRLPAIPKLENNIKCGNSLIGSDFYEDNSPSLFNLKEKRKINTFDWDGPDGFPQIMKAGGFDVVIGNPPYRTLLLGKKQDIDNADVIKYYLSNLPNGSQYKMNLYALFIEKMINVINKTGLFSYIIPNVLYNAFYFGDLRKLLLNNGMFLQALDLRYKVFPDAEIGGNGIFIYTRKDNIISKRNFTLVSVINSQNEFFNPFFVEVECDFFYKNSNFEIFYDDELNKINNKIANVKTVPIGKIIIMYQGIITGDNNKYLSKSKINNNWKKILRGRDIDRYVTKYDNMYVNYQPNLLWSNTKIEMFNVKEKIISRQTSDRLIATLDNNKYFSLDSTHVIHLKEKNDLSLKYILGIFNSTFFNFLYKSKIQELGRVFAQVKTVNVKPLPLKTIDFTNKKEKAQHDKMVSLVEQMLENQKYLHSAGNESDKQMYQKICNNLDSQIDRLVYDLYELTPEEVDIVEGEGK